MSFANSKVGFVGLFLGFFFARDAFMACCLYFGCTVLKLFLSHVSSV